MNDSIADRVIAKGVVFAKTEDAAAALMRIVSDSTIHGNNEAQIWHEYTQMLIGLQVEI